MPPSAIWDLFCESFYFRQLFARVRSTSANNDENKMTSKINLILHEIEAYVNGFIVWYSEWMKKKHNELQYIMSIWRHILGPRSKMTTANAEWLFLMKLHASTNKQSFISVASRWLLSIVLFHFHFHLLRKTPLRVEIWPKRGLGLGNEQGLY